MALITRFLLKVLSHQKIKFKLRSLVLPTFLVISLLSHPTSSLDASCLRRNELLPYSYFLYIYLCLVLTYSALSAQKIIHHIQSEQFQPAEEFHGAQLNEQMWLMPEMINVSGGIIERSLIATHMLYKQNSNIFLKILIAR